MQQYSCDHLEMNENNKLFLKSSSTLTSAERYYSGSSTWQSRPLTSSAVAAIGGLRRAASTIHLLDRRHKTAQQVIRLSRNVNLLRSAHFFAGYGQLYGPLTSERRRRVRDPQHVGYVLFLNSHILETYNP